MQTNPAIVKQRKPSPTYSLTPIENEVVIERNDREQMEAARLLTMLSGVILSNYSAFNKSTFFQLAKASGLPLSEISNFYEDFCAKMVKSKRIEAIPSIDFDSILYKVIG
jgi:hypothetical protein